MSGGGSKGAGENKGKWRSVTVHRLENKGKFEFRLLATFYFPVASWSASRPFFLFFFFFCAKILRRLSHAVFFGVNGSHSIFIILTSPSHAHVQQIKPRVYIVIFLPGRIGFFCSPILPSKNFGQRWSSTVFKVVKSCHGWTLRVDSVCQKVTAHLEQEKNILAKNE